LVVLSYGRNIGVSCVVHSGVSVTFVGIVKDGKQIPNTLLTLPIGGKHVGGMFFEKIKAKYPDFGTTTAEQSILQDIKNKHCRVAMNLEDEISDSKEIEYELPDSQKLSLGSELFESTGK
jgi:actin-related protein